MAFSEFWSRLIYNGQDGGAVGSRPACVLSRLEFGGINGVGKKECSYLGRRLDYENAREQK
jgi:hypothetical protein